MDGEYGLVGYVGRANAQSETEDHNDEQGKSMKRGRFSFVLLCVHDWGASGGVPLAASSYTWVPPCEPIPRSAEGG
jgi:hypothetical protein